MPCGGNFNWGRRRAPTTFRHPADHAGVGVPVWDARLPLEQPDFVKHR